MADAANNPRPAPRRPDLIAPPLRRHSWINIAGPLCAIFLGGFAAAMYVSPIGTIRWLQLTRLGWSGVTQNEVAIQDGLVTGLVTGGYPDEEPAVLIHGIGPDAALVWRGTMPKLSDAHFKAIAPNLPGFASSEHRQADYSIAYQAGAIAQLIDRLKLKQVNLVGADLGADVALYYAVDHPDRVERIVLVSGGLIGRRGAEKLKQAMLPATAEAMRAQAAMSLFWLPPMPDFMYRRMMAQLATDLPAETDMINSVPRDEAHIRARLGRIFNTLTIVMYGAKGTVFGKAAGEALHRAMPGSATVVFNGSAEYPQLDDPERFSDSLIYVLKQEEGGR
ncbi:MAG: alpha/beta fold hydrolase [Candidatus Binataceae bacterium]